MRLSDAPDPPVAPTKRKPKRKFGSSDGGYVTAESAMALPAIALVLLALTTVVGAVALQIRCVDAAQAGARALARGEAPADALAVVHELAPRRAVTEHTKRDGRVRVRVTADVPLPGPWHRLRIPVHHTAVAVDEAAPP
ncbi:TadE family type IV pilus minor pilin [Streptodolium elevatio]